MSTIDSLQIEIHSNSTNAASGIDALAKSMEKLKSNGSFGTAVKNLNNLSDSLGKFTSVSSNSSKLRSVADAVSKLASAGSFAKTITQLNKLPSALKGLDGIDVSGLGSKISSVSQAFSGMSSVKAGGFPSAVNSLGKLKDVTASLDDKTISDFVSKVELLTKKLEPLSTKLTTVKSAFSGISSSAKTAGSSLGNLKGKVNTTTLNMSSMITVLQTVFQTLQKIAKVISDCVGQAIEWEGISARFGRGFGDQAGEVYEWLQRLNKELGINTQDFMQYSSVYATMLSGFGVGSKDASKMALGYMELTYDIWAGYNDIYKTLEESANAVRSAIAGEIEPIRKAGFSLTESTLKQTAANHGLEISLANATEAQKSYLRYLTLVDQAHAQNLVGTYAKELNTGEGLMRTFTQQLKSLAQTFGAVFLPVLTRILPWLQAFVELLGEAIRRVAQFFGIEIQKVDSWNSAGSSLGNIADSAENATGNLDDTAGAIDKTTDALKDLKRATIGIDELNVISPPSSSGGLGSDGGLGGAGNGGLGEFEGLDVDSLWDQSIFDSVQMQTDKIKNLIKDSLGEITAIASGFALAIGLILALTGINVPTGIALIAVGAVGLVATIAENWNHMSDRLAKVLTIVTAVVSGFLLALGASLAFSGGNVGLGITLMAAGAVSLATAVTINWKFLNGEIKNALSILTGIVGGALLALGASMAFSGANIGLGIALMAAGATSLVTVVGLNWNALSDPVKKAVGALEAIVGGALLAIGALEAFTGVKKAHGIAMMAAGAVSLVSAVALNWNALTSDLKSALGATTAIIGGAVLAIGVILAYFGVNMPLAISLIATGAVSLVSAAALNWGGIVDTIKSVLKAIGIAAGSALLALGVILVCTGVSLPYGIALIAAGAVSLISGVALNWNSICSSIKGVLKEIGIIGGASLLALGLILVCTGVGIPLGVSLIAAGAAGLVSGTALNWGSIVDTVSDTCDEIADLFTGLWDKCVGGVKKVYNGVVGWFTDLWDTLVGHSIVPDTIDGITDEFTSLPGRILGSVKNFVTGVVDKFKGLGSSLVSKVSSAWSEVKTWWGKKTDLSKYTPSIGSIKDKLSSAWSSAKTWWSKSKSALSKYTPSIGSIKDKLSSAWSTAKKWWSKSKGSMSYTPSIGSIKNSLSSAWSTAKKWWNSNARLSVPSMSMKVTYTTSGLGSVKKAIVKALGLSGWPKLSFAKNGGIFDAGSLIWAGEAGAEIVANAGGGKTGVMNVDQMQDAVYQGVYDAVMAAMRSRSDGGDVSVKVYLDGKQVTESVERYQYERGSTFVRGRIPSY